MTIDDQKPIDKHHPDHERYRKAPTIEPGHSFASVTDKISSIVLTKKTGKGWFIGFGISFAVLMMMNFSISVLLAKGVGVWGLNHPVFWGFAIINFVWWIGIGHAGTLISAILLLLHQEWRTSINRFAEAMTLFAVACAGMFPLLHLGRPWFFYWTLPYPNTMGLWPQFRSPLIWDVFAVSTYATVSLMFWYVGLIPDFATLRDRAKQIFVKYIYGALSFGWRGSAKHWQRYETAYLLLAGLSTPLVVSVHTVVSFDFAVGIVPGWHSTFFPPYFVAGAIYAGFAMVLTLGIPLRKAYGLQDFITMRHLENMGKVMLATGLIVGYAYIMEMFYGWYSGNIYEMYQSQYRALGDYWWAYWLLILCNILAPQAIWFKKVRTSTIGLWVVAAFVGVGMWVERFVIVVTSLSRDFVPSSWGHYTGTVYDWTLLIGSLGLFCTLLFLFIRFVPMISIFEMRGLVSETTGSKEG